MTDRIVPSGGSTTDISPEIRIRMNEPLWPGAEVRILRNGEYVGLATILTPVELSFTDNVPPGQYEYRAEVKYDDRTAVSLPYFIMIVTGASDDVPQPTIVQLIDLMFGEPVPEPVVSSVEGETTQLPPEVVNAQLMAMNHRERSVMKCIGASWC